MSLSFYRFIVLSLSLPKYQNSFGPWYGIISYWCCATSYRHTFFFTSEWRSELSIVTLSAPQKNGGGHLSRVAVYFFNNTRPTAKKKQKLESPTIQHSQKKKRDAAAQHSPTHTGWRQFRVSPCRSTGCPLNRVSVEQGLYGEVWLGWVSCIIFPI